MQYLVVYPATDQEDKKEIISSSTEAAKYIEDILRVGNINEDKIKLYQIEGVDYRVERVPVVKLPQKSHLF